MDNFSFVPCEMCQEPILFEEYQAHISICQTRNVIRIPPVSQQLNTINNQFGLFNAIGNGNDTINTENNDNLDSNFEFNINNNNNQINNNIFGNINGLNNNYNMIFSNMIYNISDYNPENNALNISGITYTINNQTNYDLEDNNYDSLLNLEEQIGIVEIGVSNIEYVAPLLKDKKNIFVRYHKNILAKIIKKEKQFVDTYFLPN